MKTRILSYLILVLFFLIPSSGFAQDSLGISHESISYSFWDYATDAAISGNYAYIGTRETGIKVVDISDIANPFEVAQCRLAGNVQQVAIYDEYLFVPCDYEGMYIIDVSVPEDPEIVYRYTPRRAFEVTFYDHYAFVTVVSDGFSILDITNPAEPELVTNVNPPNGMVKHLKLTETHAFVGKNISEMLIYNIEDIENPVQVGTAEHNNTIDDMELVQEDYLYAISEYGHLQIFNISDPENVEMAAVFVDYNYTEMTQAFPYLFVRSGDTSQYVLDISDPLNPEEVTFLGNLPWHRVVIIDDQNAIACSGEDGIFTLDYQNIAEIEELGVYDTEGRVYGVCLWDHYALLSGKDYGLMIVDVSEPSNPVEVGHYQSEGRIINVEVMDHYALLANQELGLEIIDIIDPANPQLVSQFESQDGYRAVAVDGNLVFVSGGNRQGLDILDCTDPVNPELLSNTWIGYECRGIDIQGNYAYLAMAYGAVSIVDIRDLTNPEVIAAWGEDTHIEEIVAYNDIIFAAEWSYGVTMLDVSDPTRIFEIHHFDTGGNVRDVFIANDLLYVASEGTGLYIIDPNDPDFAVVGYYETINRLITVVADGRYAYMGEKFSFQIFDCGEAVGYDLIERTPHYEAVLPTNRPYSIIINNATWNELPLTEGDEIGVFDGNLCVGAAIHEGDFPLEITVWEENEAEGLGGFTVGNGISFLVWQSEAEAEYQVDVDWIEGDGLFGFDPLTVAELTLHNQPLLQINLRGNYHNLVSSYLVPDELGFEEVFGGINNLQIVYEDEGDIFIPGIPTVGEVDNREGYKIFTSEPSTWHTTGTPLDQGIEFELFANRWNWLGYPFGNERPLETTLSEIEDQLVALLTDDGGIYINNPPQFVINTIGNLEAGKGYMVFVNEDVSFEYLSDTWLERTPTTPQITDIPIVEGAPEPTGLPYVVVISNYEHLADKSTIVELYDGEILVGKGLLLEDQPVTPILAWQGDSEHNMIGFEPGNPIHLKLLAANGDVLVDRIVEGVQYGDAPYALLELSNILPEQSEDFSLPGHFTVQNAYPNPFNSTLSIPFSLPHSSQVTIQLYNVLGQLQSEATQQFEAGKHIYSIQGEQLVSGLYFLKVEMEGQTFMQKVVLLK